VLFSFVIFVVSLRVCLSTCSFFVVCLFCGHCFRILIVKKVKDILLTKSLHV
jgi:hypothetical protein